MLIILVAGGYFGLKTWREQPEWLVRSLPKSLIPASPDSSSSSSTESTSERSSSEIPSGPISPTPPAKAGGATVATPVVPAVPNFVSRIRPSAAVGETGKVAPGRFLMVDRVSVQTKDGIIAVVAGDEVRLLKRHKDGNLTVTNGQAEFVVKESQVTQDIAMAQAAEVQEFQKRLSRAR